MPVKKRPRKGKELGKRGYPHTGAVKLKTRYGGQPAWTWGKKKRGGVGV